MKKARPMGIPKFAHISSLHSKSSSQTVRMPAGRYSGSPECLAQHTSHEQTMRRSTRCRR